MLYCTPVFHHVWFLIGLLHAIAICLPIVARFDCLILVAAAFSWYVALVLLLYDSLMILQYFIIEFRVETCYFD